MLVCRRKLATRKWKRKHGWTRNALQTNVTWYALTFCSTVLMEVRYGLRVKLKSVVGHNIAHTLKTLLRAFEISVAWIFAYLTGKSYPLSRVLIACSQMHCNPVASYPKVWFTLNNNTKLRTHHNYIITFRVYFFSSFGICFFLTVLIMH
jgi:hypothetical protein